MVRETYTKPEFGFQEMALFERVADVCWGTSQVWLDANGDSHATDGLDIHISTGGGCQGSWSAEALTGAIADTNEVLNAFNESQNPEDLMGISEALCKWAIDNKCTYIAPITASPSSNWANTKQKSGGGIIIIGS